MKKQKQEADKFLKSVRDLEHALTFLEKAKKDVFYLSGIAKSFEICLEYAWKHLKKRVTEEGLEVNSPREAIKLAGRIKTIDDVEKWLGFLEDRNLAVHDYLGMSDEEYLETIQDFLIEARKILKIQATSINSGR